MSSDTRIMQPQPSVSLMKPKEIWNTMPGWGIVANLTPPELVEARRLRVLRRFIFAGLAALVLLCLALYALASLSDSSARSALSSEQDTTNSLTQSQNRYADVTKIQTTVGSVNAKLAQVLAADIDLKPLLAQLRQALPHSLDIKNLSLSTTGATATSAAANGLDTSGNPIVGSVTIVGDARTFQGVSDYVDALSRIPGVANVVPTSAQGGKASVSYNITLNLTSKLYSHRYDTVAKAGN